MSTVGTRDIVAPVVPNTAFEVPYTEFQDGGTSFLSLVEEAVGLVVMPSGFGIPNLPSLRQPLLAELRISRAGVLALTYLDAEEYGSGKTENEAVADLLSSLVGYKESLESREDRLSDSALSDLAKLRDLFGATQ